MRHLSADRSLNTQPGNRYIESGSERRQLVPSLEYCHPGLDPGSIFTLSTNSEDQGGFRIKSGTTRPLSL